MNKEFVPYEQALALKELGFDEECFAVYYDTKEFKTYTGAWPKLAWVKFNSKFDGRGVISAPLYQQAFRWFREKYNIIPNIHSIYKDETHTKIEFWFWFGNYEDDSDDEVFYSTYEEAELECLKKLIEIVKERQSA